MYITYTISLSVFSGASSFIRCSSIYNNTCIHIDLLAAHNDEGCPDNIHTHFSSIDAEKKARLYYHDNG
jgi:hypothetical protein